MGNCEGHFCYLASCHAGYASDIFNINVYTHICIYIHDFHCYPRKAAKHASTTSLLPRKPCLLTYSAQVMQTSICLHSELLGIQNPFPWNQSNPDVQDAVAYVFYKMQGVSWQALDAWTTHMYIYIHDFHCYPRKLQSTLMPPRFCNYC